LPAAACPLPPYHLVSQVIGARTSHDPARLLASELLMDHALSSTLAKHGMPDTADLAQERQLTRVDDGSDDGTQLLGSGQSVPAADVDDARAAVRRYVMHGDSMLHHPAGWSEEDVDTAQLCLYAYARVRGEEVVLSRRYRRARTRHSYIARCALADGDKYMAAVQYFLLVTHPTQPESTPPLRLAVAAVYKAQHRLSWQGRVWCVQNWSPDLQQEPGPPVARATPERPDGYLYALPLHDVLRKYVVSPQHDGGALCAGYTNLSGRG
jgi:hypothetical protein